MITSSRKNRNCSLRELEKNLNRLPREVEATLPSWVKCTDPISGKRLKKYGYGHGVDENVRNYLEETETNNFV